MKMLLWTIAVLAGLAALVVVAGRLGWLMGRTPDDLGVRDGRLKAPARTPNSVSSQAELWRGTDALVDYAQIAPLAYSGEPAAAIEKLRKIMLSIAGSKVVTAEPDYLYAQVTTATLRFVDDVEFYVVPADKVIHVRSASRVGRRDFGVNRARIETVRAAFAAQ